MAGKRREDQEAAQRASTRAARDVHEQMKRGLWSLASIASVAPWIGILGTLWAILTFFARGITGARGTIKALLAGWLGESLIFTCFGLATAITAYLFYRYLSERMHEFDQEMHSVTLELMNDLLRLG